MVSKLSQVVRFGLILILGLGMNLTSLAFSASPTTAYYADGEASTGNSFQAQMLDFDITNNKQSGYVGLEADGDIDDFSSLVTQHTDSLDVQYSVQSELVGGESDFCETLGFEVNHLGTTYTESKTDTNSILDISRSTTTSKGTWEFKDLDLENEATQFAHGTECEVDLIFSGWRDGVATPSESGYTDQERISLRLKNRMVVMNEFLPNPDASAHGLDYGSDYDDKPNGEWIELYNNSEKPHSINGWYFEDAANNVTNIHAANTQPSTTTIPAKSWLVVYLDGAVLNNTGDTIKLKDDSGNVVDEYSYDGGEYCENEPTPNATNTASVSGDCNSVSPNKSFARIPDGVGSWVDPIPTPGAGNTLQQPQSSTTPDVAGTSTDQIMSTSTQASTDTGTSTTADTNAGTSTETSTDTDTQSASGTAASSTEETASTAAESSGSSGGGSGDEMTPVSGPADASDNLQATMSTSTPETAGTSTTASTTEKATSSNETLGGASEVASSTASSTPGSQNGDDNESASSTSADDNDDTPQATTTSDMPDDEGATTTPNTPENDTGTQSTSTETKKSDQKPEDSASSSDLVQDEEAADDDSKDESSEQEDSSEEAKETEESDPGGAGTEDADDSDSDNNADDNE